MRPATTDDVLDLLDGTFTSAALGAALELGLFRRLAERPMDAARIAETLDIPAGRCHHWLQILARAGLLEEGPDGYALSPTARSAILDAHDPESWALLAEEARMRSAVLQDLTLHLREPGSVRDALGQAPPSFYDKMSASPELARRFTRMLYDLHREKAEALAKLLDLSGVGRLMDLGGGSGVLSLALLRRHSGLTSVVVEMQNVCAAGQEIAAENGLDDRIQFLPLDFLQDDLPAGFDMVLEHDVNIYNEALFRKVRASLNPGGRFVLIDQLAPAPGVAHPSRLHWALAGSLRDPEFRFPTAAEIRDQMAAAGFERITVRNLADLEGTATRFTSGSVLIEAFNGA